MPVDREPLGDPSLHGGDRLFVHVRLESTPDEGQDRAVQALADAGRPIYTIRVADPYEIGAEFFRWEIGTAVAGALIGINPFDQLQITCDDAHDLAIPGRRATFGVVKAAQARGDLTVLHDRGRRALRIHLGTDVATGLDALRVAVALALPH